MRRDGLIKIALTALFFIVLFSRLDLHELWSTLLSLNLKYLILSMFFVPILYIIRTYRWGVLLKSVGIEKIFVNLFKVLLIGVFYGLITPGKVGELSRAYYLDEKKSVTISTILMEKLIDVFVLALLSIITLIIFFHNNPILTYVILISAFAAILSTWLFANKRFLSLVTKLFKIKYEDVEIFTDSFSRLRKNRSAMSKTTFLAFLYYLVHYILAILMLYSMGANPFAVVTLPLIILMGNVPITISGLGMRESIGAICFVLLGESGAQGFLFSLLLFFTITLIPGIFGYLLTIKDKTMFAGNRRTGAIK